MFSHCHVNLHLYTLSWRAILTTKTRKALSSMRVTKDSSEIERSIRTKMSALYTVRRSAQPDGILHACIAQ